VARACGRERVYREVEKVKEVSEEVKNLLDQSDLICYNENMKTLQSAEAKSHFSSILKDVEAGTEVAIAYGRKKKTVAVIIPYEKWKKSKKRQLGTLEGKMSVRFAANFSMTDDELANS
jgi:antitoxin (DNA-binding transcriptional repressor) of toxin-antitoxin stability system